MFTTFSKSSKYLLQRLRARAVYSVTRRLIGDNCSSNQRLHTAIYLMSLSQLFIARIESGSCRTPKLTKLVCLTKYLFTLSAHILQSAHCGYRDPARDEQYKQRTLNRGLYSHPKTLSPQSSVKNSLLTLSCCLLYPSRITALCKGSQDDEIMSFYAFIQISPRTLSIGGGGGAGN